MDTLPPANQIALVIAVPRVAVYCKTTAQEAGQTVVTLFDDIYPSGSSTGLRSLDASIDLTGPKTTLVTEQVTSTAVAFTTLPWWKLKVPAFSQPETVPASLALVNTAINDGSKNCITVVDDNGNPVNLTTYPCVMEHEGTIQSWMQLSGGAPVLSIKAIVTGYFTYQRQKNIGTAASPVWVTVKSPNIHPQPVRVTLTNSPAGTSTYQLSQLLSAGENYPEWYVVLPSLAPVASGTAGATLMTLAKYIYLSLQTLSYQFDHTILEQPFATMIKPGKHALNVSGGASAWASMNAMIQEVTIDFINSPATGLTSARTSVRCGPVEHLEAGQLVQLFNLFVNRDLNKISPNERQTGAANGGSNVGVTGATAKENSTQGEPEEGQQMFSAPDSVNTANFNGILQDPANGQINVTTYQASSSTPVGTGLIAPCYFGSGAPAAGTLPANVNFRVNWRYLDTTGNAEYYCATAGTNTTSTWTQLSGGGGGSVWI